MAGPRVLAQHAGTGAQVTAYTSPAAGKGTVISSVVLVGTTAATSTSTARLRIAPAAAADADVHEVLPATTVPAGRHDAYTEGLTLAPGDVVRVLASTGVNVHLYGTEY